jgi:hypothetical protein
MNILEFASTLIGDLIWPIVVLAIIVVFRRPLAELIGRVKSYEGLGQKVTFGEELADAEDSVNEAVEGIKPDTEDSEKREAIEPSPLVREAEANPSFVVIQSWEQLSAALEDLVGAAFPDQVTRGTPVGWLPGLQRRDMVSPDFVKAVRELRYLRNKVAHGQHNPTPGEAVAYAESAQALAATARIMADFVTRNM